MNRLPGIVWIAFSIGALFSTLFAYSFVAYFWGDGDEGRFAVCGLFSIFTAPLLIGAILIMYRRPAGLGWLRFGSILFLFALQLEWALKIWQLNEDPHYIAWMTGMLPIAKQPQSRSVTSPKRPWFTAPASSADSSPSQDHPRSTT
ncbi:hypothetical protein R5W24_002103 [Gemmata sp. JC717]|uniref:hypothetical protein n=1 Tax=Gemmata algarum TaxID=2975278 RepID=UPI0021BB4F5C|nr:hypothetical protein [Gemmata algarum]MDY3553013.1 hypothetical protein [Gemmata algarum]